MPRRQPKLYTLDRTPPPRDGLFWRIAPWIGLAAAIAIIALAASGVG